MIIKESTLTLKPKPSPRKKTRTKLRKQKYLSLKLQLTATQPQPQPPMPTTNNHQLINLFPLHPEHLMEQDKLDMSSIFSSCDDDGAATTLTGILSSDEEDIEVNTKIKNETNMDKLSPSPANLADEEREEREERDLVRTAMRRNKSDHCYEKWVCYNEVVERRKVVRGISSSSSSTTSYYYNNHERDHNKSKLVLKLDYEKIMKSWVNKGPLYVCDDLGLDGPLPQTVPDIRDDDFFLPYNINGLTHDARDNGANEGSWVVPEMTHIGNNDTYEGDDALGSSTIIHNREASVQRYKEKRRNRLFSKTIRYEVRKLNAEKRPRIKGRFVKRN